MGEAPGVEEERTGLPFHGASGRLLNTLLHRVGIDRDSCFVTNVVHLRPPGNDISEWISDRKTPPSPDWIYTGGKWVHPNIATGLRLLQATLSEVSPSLVIALGGTALWALTGHEGISKWRGSRLSPPDAPWQVIPSLHPAACLRQAEMTPILAMDLKRARLIYEQKQTPRHYDFQIEPPFENARHTLEELLALADAAPIRLAGDIETRMGRIACLGIAWSASEAICIPFLRANEDEPFYWSVREEAELVYLIQKLFRHPNILWLGQNYLYDCQYYHRWWLVEPHSVFDTMVGHHSVYSTMRKGLDFLSSMYAHDHVYWKDESKEWDPKIGERQYWTYNCKDACITWEVAAGIEAEIAEQGVEEHARFQQSLFFPVLRMMNRGIRIDNDKRILFRQELKTLAIKRQETLDTLAGHPLNPRSPAQLSAFFYKDLRQAGIRNFSGEGITTNSQAMGELSKREPLLKPVCQLITELRSIGVFISTFVDASLDTDGRMRCSFAIAGPSTYRFASSENAFGSGMNLQNVPEKEKRDKGREVYENYVKLPNIRQLFIPDPGMESFDGDLDRADLQVVVWEAEDSDLKQALRLGADMHCLSACEIFDIKGIPPDELVETHPNYPEHRGRIGYDKRQKTKNGVHATNYGVGDYKLSITLGVTQHEASKFKARWFAAHPGILRWHKRVEALALSKGYIENKFGARFYILGRFELPEALAWVPQSTVAGVINRVLKRIDEEKEANLCDVELLLQVHDSLAGQFPIAKRQENLSTLARLGRVVIPYDDPLIIPMTFKTSQKSWGHCKG